MLYVDTFWPVDYYRLGALSYRAQLRRLCRARELVKGVVFSPTTTHRANFDWGYDDSLYPEAAIIVPRAFLTASETIIIESLHVANGSLGVHWPALSHCHCHLTVASLVRCSKGVINTIVA